MENKLIPLTEFVNRIDELVPNPYPGKNTEHNFKQFNIVRNYAAFLSKPLKLEYFVPTNEEGNVLEEPKITHIAKFQTPTKSFEDFQRMYNEVKSKILFEGFEWNPSTKQAYNNKIGLTVDKAIVDKGKHSVEYLLLFNPILSQTALKQIYG